MNQQESNSNQQNNNSINDLLKGIDQSGRAVISLVEQLGSVLTPEALAKLDPIQQASISNDMKKIASEMEKIRGLDPMLKQAMQQASDILNKSI